MGLIREWWCLYPSNAWVSTAGMASDEIETLLQQTNKQTCQDPSDVSVPQAVSNKAEKVLFDLHSLSMHCELEPSL